MIKDYYELLQVHPKASADIIKKAYQTLAKKYHPDLSKLPPEEASRHMSELNEAYRILSDPAKRSQYDEARRQEQHKVQDLPREQQNVHPDKIPPRSARRHHSREKEIAKVHDIASGKLKIVALIAVIVLLLGGMIWFFGGDDEDGEVHYKSLKGNPSVEERSREKSQPAPAPAPSYDSNEEKLHPGNPNRNGSVSGGTVEIDGKREVPTGGTEQNPKAEETEKTKPESKDSTGGGTAVVGETI